MHPSRLVLIVVISTLLCSVKAFYGVTVTFSNECSESVRVQFEGGVGDDVVTISPGDEHTFTLCSGGCTGWFGTCYQYPWSYVAKGSEGCNGEIFEWSDSGTEEICVLDAFGVGQTIPLNCPDVKCPPPPPSPPPPFLLPPTVDNRAINTNIDSEAQSNPSSPSSPFPASFPSSSSQIAAQASSSSTNLWPNSFLVLVCCSMALIGLA